jgi:hypothetical protein
MTTMVDAVLAAVCKAVYGDTVDPAELAKWGPGPSDVHVEDSMSRKDRPRGSRIAVGPQTPLVNLYARRMRAGKKLRVLPPQGHGDAWRGETKKTIVSRPAKTKVQILEVDSPKRPGKEQRSTRIAVSKLDTTPTQEKTGKKKLLAAGLLAGAAAEAVAAKDTVPELVRGVKAVRPAVRSAEGAGAKVKAIRPLLVAPNERPMVPGHPLLPAAMGPAPRSAAQMANFAVGLGAARELMPHRKKQPVVKALRLRLRPVNPGVNVHPPSIKARRPAGAPANVGKAYKPFKKTRKMTEDIRRTAAHAERASGEAAEIGGKVKRLIPSPKVAGAVLGGTVAASTLGSGLASYYGTKHGVKAGMRKSFTATGEIAKADDDQHLVFGWASVSEINGEPVVDRQGDIIPTEELEKAAYDYALDCRVGGDQHSRLGKGIDTGLGPRQTGALVESMVFTDDKIAKMGLPEDMPRGWWVGFKVSDEPTWQAIKNGERTGFSLHGRGKRDALFGMSKGVRELTAVRESQQVLESMRGTKRYGVWAKAQDQHMRNLSRAFHVGHTPEEIQAASGEARGARGFSDPAAIRSAVGANAWAARGGHTYGRMSKGEHTESLKRRTRQAIHPPNVKLVPVQSSAIKAMGYQPQSRRLAYAMHSRPEQAYNYKATPKQAAEAQEAQSLGRHYATQVRGKYPRKEKVTVVDRARLFANPAQDVDSSDRRKQLVKAAWDALEPSVQTRRRRAQQLALGAQTTAGTVGVGFGASKLRDAFAEEHPAAFRQHTMRIGQNLVRRGVKPATAEKVVRVMRVGKPGFKELAAAGTAGLVATGAHRYLQVSQIKGEKKPPNTPAAQAATGLGAQALF